MAINKINIDGVEHELAGSGGGGSNELVYELDLTPAIGSSFDYLLTETWFAENVNDDNIKNLKIKVIINDNKYICCDTLLSFIIINGIRKLYINLSDTMASLLGQGYYIQFNDLYQIQEVNNI